MEFPLKMRIKTTTKPSSHTSGHTYIYMYTLRKLLTEKDGIYSCVTTALFAVAGTGKQRGWLLTDERIERLWYMYTMEY